MKVLKSLSLLAVAALLTVGANAQTAATGKQESKPAAAKSEAKPAAKSDAKPAAKSDAKASPAKKSADTKSK